MKQTKKIEVRPARPRYTVTWGKHRCVVATPKAAAHRVAWWVIWERYPHAETWPARLDCECGSDPDFPRSPKDCPVHDTGYGYFSRLHERLARWMEPWCAEQIRIHVEEARASMPALQMPVSLWPMAMRSAATTAARAFLATQADKQAARSRGAGWEERELVRLLMTAYVQGMGHAVGTMIGDHKNKGEK